MLASGISINVSGTVSNGQMKCAAKSRYGMFVKSQVSPGKSSESSARMLNQLRAATPVVRAICVPKF